MTILLVDYRASIGCFRENAGERRHIHLIIVGYTAPVRQSDRLDPHFQKWRRVEKISAAQNRPASGLTQNENPLCLCAVFAHTCPELVMTTTPRPSARTPVISPPSNLFVNG